MAHARARLSVFGRQVLVRRIDAQGWPVALAAESLGISRATAYKWLRRHRTEGLARLSDLVAPAPGNPLPCRAGETKT